MEIEFEKELAIRSLIVKSIWEQGCGTYNPDWCKVCDELQEISTVLQHVIYRIPYLVELPSA